MYVLILRLMLLSDDKAIWDCSKETEIERSQNIATAFFVLLWQMLSTLFSKVLNHSLKADKNTSHRIHRVKCVVKAEMRFDDIIACGTAADIVTGADVNSICAVTGLAITRALHSAIKAYRRSVAEVS